MGLIEKEIKELRKLLDDFEQGKVTKEQVATRISIYKQTEQRMKLAIQAVNLVAKYKKDALGKFLDSGFPQLLGPEKEEDKEQIDE
jgi:predicted type IV restriction endonuclease